METSEDVVLVELLDVVEPVKTDVDVVEQVETSEDAEPPTKRVKKVN